MNKGQRKTTLITLAGLGAIALALLLSRYLWFRLDLTKNKMYTISAVSRNLHTEIPSQVDLTYYLSDRLAAMHPVPGEIANMLREYIAFSHGKITLAVRDPVKAKAEEEIQALGVQPQQIQTEERNETSFALVYSALVIKYGDKTEVLPVQPGGGNPGGGRGICLRPPPGLPPPGWTPGAETGFGWSRRIPGSPGKTPRAAPRFYQRI